MWTGCTVNARSLGVIGAQPHWLVSWRSHSHSSDTCPTHWYLHGVIDMHLSTWWHGKEGLWPLVMRLAHSSPPSSWLEWTSPPERQFIFTWAQSHANAVLQLSKWSWLGAGMCLASMEHKQKILSMQIYSKLLLKCLISVKTLQTCTHMWRYFLKHGRNQLLPFFAMVCH